MRPSPSTTTSPWLHITCPNPQAQRRLFCFPYAGGAASIYRRWHQHLPKDVEVCAVQLPAREHRIREEAFRDAGALIQAFLPYLLPYLDKPFAVFGHSMGALLAFELTRQLHQQVGLLPTHLFVSGRRAPVLPEREPLLHTIPGDDAFLQAVHERYGNVPDILFQDAELRVLFLPLLRADFTLVETYAYEEGTALPCPIVAFGGAQDERVPRQDLAAWQRLTQSNFELHLLSGGHFYLTDQYVPLLNFVNRTFRR